MARGRKPKTYAKARGGIVPVETVNAQIVEVDIPIPPKVANDPDLAEKWALCVDTHSQLRPEDAPLIEAWCVWAVVEDKSAPAALALDPEAIRTHEKATTMLMRLADALHLSPTARQRAGLIESVTRSSQLDVAAKTRAEFYARSGK